MAGLYVLMVCTSKARNKMLNLGTIDGWIDNYALWQKGKPITIAGKQYSKESTGQSATLISAKEGDVDLFDTLYGKTGVFFLEASSDYGFWSRTFVNVGTATSNSNMFLVSILFLAFSPVKLTAPAEATSPSYPSSLIWSP